MTGYKVKSSEIVKLTDEALLEEYGRYCMMVGNCKAVSRRKPSEVMVDCEKAIKDFKAEIRRRIAGGHKSDRWDDAVHTIVYSDADDCIFIRAKRNPGVFGDCYIWELRSQMLERAIVNGASFPKNGEFYLNAVLRDVKKALMEYVDVIREYEGNPNV